MNKILDDYWRMEKRWEVNDPSPLNEVLGKEVLFFSKHVPLGDVVYDIGCGRGRGMQVLDSHGYRSVGFDVGVRNLALCLNAGFRAHWADACNMHMVGVGEAENIFCRSTLNYVHNLSMALHEMGRILAEDGFCYVGVGIGDRERWANQFGEPQTIEDLLKIVGIHKVRCKTVVYQDSPYHMYVGKKK